MSIIKLLSIAAVNDWPVYDLSSGNLDCICFTQSNRAITSDNKCFILFSYNFVYYNPKSIMLAGLKRAGDLLTRWSQTCVRMW